MSQGERIAVHNDGAAVLAFARAKEGTDTCQIIFQRILTAFQKCRIRFSYRYAFEAHMFEYRNILRLGKNLIAYNTTSHGFGFQIADDTVGESLVLEGFLNSDITHNSSAKGTGTYQFTIGKKTHSVFDISCKGKAKAVQKFNHFCFFSWIC